MPTRSEILLPFVLVAIGAGGALTAGPADEEFFRGAGPTTPVELDRAGALPQMVEWSKGGALRIWAEASAGSRAADTSLNISVQSGGSNAVVVAPGATVNYEVIALLSNDANLGLALVGFDLIFDGGDLPHADIPTGVPTPGCDNPMINSTLPWGLTNPDSPCPPSCGYGGTIISGDLVQVGGGQNTINNTPENAPFPIGPVLLGVAQPAGCGPAVLVTGSLTAPAGEGTYSLSLTNLFANVIRLGETGDPFWATEVTDIGTITNLTIEVVESGGSIPTVSEWSLIIMMLLAFTAGTLLFGRRCRAKTAA